MRKHLSADYSQIYIIDLGGNVRLNPKLSGTTHNVFGIQVGVAITLLIRQLKNDTQEPAKIHYVRMQEDWRRGQKTAQLEKWQTLKGPEWHEVTPSAVNTWINHGEQQEFTSQIPMGIKLEQKHEAPHKIFAMYSLGIASNRDAYTFNFKDDQVQENMKASILAYSNTLTRFDDREDEDVTPDEFVDTFDKKTKWTRQTKASLARDQRTKFDSHYIRVALYRPFTKLSYYFDDFWNEERYKQHRIFPTAASENKAICVPAIGARTPPWTLATTLIPSLTLTSVDANQCFSFYIYEEDGTNRRENITDWALNEYRTHYSDQAITKWDIFHATYAVLHHPEYRTRYAANLKRELPRIPFPPDFHAFAAAGKRLMELHIDYEKQDEYPLEQLEDPKAELTFRVDRMKLSKDKTILRYNDFLTLRGIPPAAFDYRLGNRSALEWIIDQYRVSTDPRSGIVNDPNREDDPQYILRLIGQVITVSLETQQLIAALPTLNLPGTAATQRVAEQEAEA